MRENTCSINAFSRLIKPLSFEKGRYIAQDAPAPSVYFTIVQKIWPGSLSFSFGGKSLSKFSTSASST